MSSPIDDLAKIGRFESSIKFILASIFTIVLVIISIFSFKNKNYKAGFICLGIAALIFSLSYYTNKLVQSSTTYAAASGTNNLWNLVTGKSN